MERPGYSFHPEGGIKLISEQPLIFDIESIPHRQEEYHQAFPKSKKKPGLHAIISEVVAIGIVDGQQPTVISQGETMTEVGLLTWFAQVLREHRNAPIVGFNIKNFDIPFLTIRAAKHGIKLDFPDKRSQRIVDLYDFLGGKWQSDISSCSLTELSWCLYGEGKATDGYNVAEWWANGDVDSIRAHCLEDILLTQKLYNDLKGVLW